MHVKEMMRTDLCTVPPETGFFTLLGRYEEMASRLLYVVDARRKLLGVISGYDFLKVMLPFYLDSNLAKAVDDDNGLADRACQTNRNKTAADIMTANCVFLRPNAHFLQAETLIKERGVNVLPIVDEEGVLVGEIDRREVLGYLARRCSLMASKQG